jgi:hypothetical protein
MRTSQIVRGLNNSQKIRIIVNGVGFHTTVEGMTHMVFTHQRIAVWNALQCISDSKLTKEPITGFASRTRYYNDQNEMVDVDYQVDLV